MDDDFGFDDSLDTGGVDDIGFDDSLDTGSVDDIGFDDSLDTGSVDDIGFDDMDTDSGLDDIDLDGIDTDSGPDDIDLDGIDTDSSPDDIDLDGIDTDSSPDDIEIEDIQNDDLQTDLESGDPDGSLDFDAEDEGYFDTIPNEVEPLIMEEEQPENIPEAADTVPEPSEGDKTPYEAMRDYMNDHNYGFMDYPEYSQDPEWQALNEQFTASLENTPQHEESTPETIAEFENDISQIETEDVLPVTEETNEVTEDVLPVTEETNDVTEAIQPLTEETNEVTEDVQPLTEETNEVTEDVQPLTEETNEVTEDIQPVTEETNEVTEDIQPVTEETNETGEVVPDVSDEVVEAVPESAEGDKTPYEALRDYMYEHNYSQMDYPEYSQDPEWQALNEQFTASLENTPQHEESTPETIAEFENDISQIETEDVLPVTEETDEAVEDIQPVTEETNEVTEDVLPVTEETNEVTEDVLPVTEETNDVTEDIQPVTEETNETGEVVPDVSDEVVEAVLESAEGDKTPYEALRDYMYEHNYGHMDYPEYSQDPGWQALNEQYTESLENTPQNEEISPEPIAEFENDSSQIETEDVLPVTEETNEVTEDIPPLTEETVEVTEVIPLATEDTNEVTEDIPPATEETNEITEDIPLATEETNEVTEDIQPVTEETNEVTEDIPPISEETNVVTEDVQPVTEETNDITDGATNELSGEAPVDLTSVEDLSEKEIDEVFESWDEERLSEGFENIEIAENQELLDNTLNNFVESNWEKLSLDEQKESMSSLAEYVTDVVGFENPPIIEYYNNEVDGDYGGYDSETNTLCINEHMLYDSNEAADTIAHELWHAHQHECAENPQSVRDYQYQYNFENYISPEMDFDSYQDQLLESEARAFAAQFKDRLEQLKGR